MVEKMAVRGACPMDEPAAVGREVEPVRTVGPRGEARRRALLEAATQLFATKGFEKTTLSDLVEAAGGSRATIYELFGDKTGLFRAVMDESNRRVIERLAAARSPASVPPDEALVRFGCHFLAGILNDETRAVVRTLVAENGRIPEIATEFWASGPEVTVRQVADYLRELGDGGRLHIDDPEAAAQLFLSMVVGELFIRSLIEPGPALPEVEIESRVRYAVGVFLNGIRARGPAAVTGRS